MCYSKHALSPMETLVSMNTAGPRPGPVGGRLPAAQHRTINKAFATGEIRYKTGSRLHVGPDDVNAVVHQYLIPGVQVGVKIRTDRGGRVIDVYAVARPVSPQSGWMACG